MNKRWIAILGIGFSAIIGWSMGYIRVPYINQDHSFWVGFFTALAFISLLFLLSTIKSKTGKPSIWLATLCALAIISCAFLFHKNKSLKIENRTNQITLSAQTETIIALEQKNLMALVAGVIAAADTEIARSSTRSLNQATIDRIADLSHSLKPYKKVIHRDSIETKSYSPERGQLLLALVKMNINEISFSQIKNRATFQQAYLPKANLAKTNLSGVDLKQANLEGAILTEANLDSANLSETNLERTSILNASLEYCNLNQAVLNWANLENCNLSYATLDGTLMSNCNIRGATIRNAFIKYAILSNSVLAGADCSGTVFHIVDLSHITFQDAVLIDVDFIRVDLTDCIFENTKISKNWYPMLTKWKTVGLQQMQKNYKVDSLSDVENISKAWFLRHIKTPFKI